MSRMAFVFIISRYGEHGLEEPMAATLDRAKLMELFDKTFPQHNYERAKLERRLLDSSDAALALLGSEALSEGWGGAMLTVVMTDG